ncbi:MAG: DUF72 domain-containing protein [Alphaproteobacteria bacterium]|jgi:uncharacterized protein YecE (DUF72 family)|nr:DUF72 domain-containing protein [Alphaproteobacteria bacterium]
MNKPRVGIGGWTFAPWRGVFYPPGLRQADELRFAGAALTAIEINATYHALQSPAAFARWRDETPADFVFSVKASRLCTHRKVLAETGPFIARFLEQGLVELGPRLGPILWQFMPTKRFDADDMARFLDLLPPRLDGLALRHVLEPRHASFVDPAFIALCRERGVAICLADHATYPLIAEPTADFVYARLMRLEESEPDGYAAPALADWAVRLEALAKGRDLFAFFIGAGGEGKVRAPAAARALLGYLRAAPPWPG